MLPLILYDRISLLCGETGENPVRARRREVHYYYESYRMPQIREMPLENPRRWIYIVLSRNIHKVKALVLEKREPRVPVSRK